ncbi:hypothetical protein [Erythrobacter sp. HKB08]|uniref:hypothetical protein n=1 Tax=Erythrobacter sp. HKB08 TaxID=2502843 RepID=UPI001008FF02|nr:hypothetical protein [Erythrobacter sp. HKB08]
MSTIDQTLAQSRERGRIEFDPWVLVAFAYPLTRLVVIEFFGRLYLTDLIGVALFVFLLKAPDAIERLARIKTVFILLALWLVSQIVTDLVRDTAPQDYLRVWAKIAFFGIQIAALWLFLPRRRAYLVAFALGMGLAAGLGVLEEYEGAEWKFGYDQAAVFILASSLILAARFAPHLRKLAPLLLGGLAAFVLFQNARSAFVVIALAAVICMLVIMVERWPALQQRIRPTGFVILLIGGIIGAGAISAGYGDIARSGALGTEAQVKHEKQTSGEISLLLGGRSESLISVRAIADSPIIGHGSWAKDRRYVELYRSLRLRLGMDWEDPFFQRRELIPTHSYFFGSWVEAGVLGAVFWLYIFTLPFIASYRLLKSREPLLPLVAFLAVGLVWAIPFSPFGSTERFTAAFQIVTLLWIIREARPEPGWWRPITFAPQAEKLSPNRR